MTTSGPFGSYAARDGSTRTLKLHWDGSHWTTFRGSSPLENHSGYVFGVASLSPRTAWSVGMVVEGAGYEAARLEYRNGAAWQFRQIGGAALSDVVGISATNVWVVGWADGIDGGEFAAHWDGERWRALGPHPVRGRTLNAVAVVSDTELWAVGWSESYFNGPSRPLVEHYGCR
jgi:hypothetical protein